MSWLVVSKGLLVFHLPPFPLVIFVLKLLCRCVCGSCRFPQRCQSLLHQKTDRQTGQLWRSSSELLSQLRLPFDLDRSISHRPPLWLSREPSTQENGGSSRNFISLEMCTYVIVLIKLYIFNLELSHLFISKYTLKIYSVLFRKVSALSLWPKRTNKRKKLFI